MSENLDTHFMTTPWTVILGSRDGGNSDRPTEALVKLCENYRYPVYAFIRKQCGDVEKARDLSQEFFAFLVEKKIYRSAAPERGKFRTFLLASVKNFLKSEHRNETTQKRGGGKVHISIDTEEAELLLGDQLQGDAAPELLFDREWANAIFDKVWRQLGEEYAQTGHAERFEALRPALMAAEDTLSYAELGQQLDLSESGVKSAVFRLRGRFRDLFRVTVAALVENPAAVDEEIAYLMQVIATSGV